MSAAQREPPDEGPASVGDLATRLAFEVQGLDRELAEIEMLVLQARSEASRHEQKRVQAAERLGGSAALPPEDLAALNAQLVTLTRRAAVMEAQVDVLEGKRKTLARFRDSLVEVTDRYGDTAASRGPAAASAATADGIAGAADGDAPPPMSRIVLNAQEDLRREIARAMHDGPAQSLTNIVLQAQIVERLLGRDLTGARSELHLLVQMVQQTLEATKTFIFDVRPMVLDDLGLVPTLRRTARERGRRAGLTVEFDSVGQDRRLTVDLESSLFRILDEALAAYLAARPDTVGIRLDWTDTTVDAELRASRRPTAAMAAAERQVQEATNAENSAGGDLPPALGAMLVERREQAEAAATSARGSAAINLPPATWREIQQRAATTGIQVELGDAGGRLHLRVETEAPVDDDAADRAVAD
ncbi:MAG TPA: histidine kinase, partial [Candidatus Limnocylindrales bacterium]|nr:histidine kinase [Candidatus Limnocylindrales bacterium]